MDESNDARPVGDGRGDVRAAGDKCGDEPTARTRWAGDPDPPAENDTAGASGGDGDHRQDSEYEPL